MSNKILLRFASESTNAFDKFNFDSENVTYKEILEFLGKRKKIGSAGNSEDTEEEVASANIRYETSNKTDHCPAPIILLLYLIGSVHTIVFIIHSGFFCPHILLSTIISRNSHCSFVKKRYIII